MSIPFVHLRIHTEFSLVDGLVRIKPLMGKLAGMGMPAVAITDQSNMCSLVKFYKAAIGNGIKPVIGVDIWLANAEEDDNPTRLTLLARNETGYKNMTELVSRGFTNGQRYGKAIIEREWLVEQAEGLIVLSGARLGDIGRAILNGRMEQAKERLAFWMDVFPESFYLELQRTGRPGDEECVHGSVALAAELNCPVVATNDVHFIAETDYDAHEARVCIHDSVTLADPRRQRRYSDQQYLKTPEQMQELFADIPSALENTVEIAKRCNVKLQLGTYFLPNYPVPEGLTMDEFFRKISAEGLEERLRFIMKPDQPNYEARRQVYFDRLKFELDIIIQMGFPGYFLIVMDFIQWAKNHGIPVGPGRGSGAGSVVAWVLKITDLDPLQYDLLFERFLNPERVSMPDFDVDFCMDGRDRVISYVADTYGRNAVSQIITFGTMAAKAVVRDVARVQGKSYGLADRLSKLIPFEVGMTLTKAIDVEPALKEFVEKDEEAQEIWEMALKLEGVTRNVGKHAGGVVIAPTKLTDYSPIYCDEHGDGLVTQFDKGDVEEAGLVKFDFLGLRTLTIIDWALAMINPKRAKKGLDAIDINAIPLDDAPSYKLLKRAETTAVFQLESRGMKDLIRRLQPDNIEDMIALVALFRPGPLESGMVDDFINRKHGRAEVAYPHPDFQHMSLKTILEPTYGVIVYQEQVMQIAQTLAGYTLGGADLLRRAMGKKKPEEMAKQREIFREGAIGQNVDPELAMKIFDLVEKFAGYGFNKSHSAAYAVVSYQTLWLKTHYPAEFMAAVLTADMQNTDKVVTLVEECRRMKLKLVLPDINVSEYTFTVDEQGQIVYGLGAIKGLGEGPVESLIEARKQGGAFKNLFDLCDRVDLRKVNKRALEAIIKAGALDAIGPSRARLIASIEEAVQRAGQNSRNQNAGIEDLFGEVIPDDSVDVYAATQGIREWSERERLGLEKETLGLFLTGHPFDEYEKEVRQFARSAISDLKPNKAGTTIAGLVVAVRLMKNKKGQNMAFVTLDDRSGRVEVSFFSEAYDAFHNQLVKDNVLILEGEVSYDSYSECNKIRADNVYDVLTARLRFARKLRLSVNASQFSKRFIDELADSLQPWRSAPGEQGCQILLNYERGDAAGDIELGASWRIKPADEMLHALKHKLGTKNVALLYE
ncbi:MAG: DNA polymerase III subunit alpha [Hahellaceae bacterium]|nr:DNA polymerase III subunit alpha [Hahellaceae bacterium]